MKREKLAGKIKSFAPERIGCACGGLTMNFEEKPQSIELVTYVGSSMKDREKILDQIPPWAKSIFDPMAGSGVVLSECKRRGMKVIANDHSISSYYYLRAAFGQTKFSEEDIEKLLKVKPISGFLSQKKSWGRPERIGSRNWLDGLVLHAKNDFAGRKRNFALGAIAQLFFDYAGSFTYFRKAREPYSIRGMKKDLRYACKQLNSKIVPGESEVTNKDVFSLEIPQVDVIYFDPPYDLKLKGEIPYSRIYHVVNSILRQKEDNLPELERKKISGLLEKFSKKCKILLVSTSSDPTIPYSKVLNRLKKNVHKKILPRKTGGVEPGEMGKGGGKIETDYLWIASDFKLEESKKFDLFHLETYDPSKASDEQLRDDIRLALGKYATMRRGGKSEFTSLDEVVDFVCKVMKEVMKREIDVHYRPERMKSYAAECFKKVITKLGNPPELIARAGIYLVSPHAEWITQGKKKAILSIVRFIKYINTPVFVLQDNNCYGVIQLSSPEKITWEDFSCRFKEHKVSDDEVERWGWKKYPNLYLQKVKVLKSLKNPWKFTRPRKVQKWIKTVNFEDFLGKVDISTDIDIESLSRRELISLHNNLHECYHGKIPAGLRLEDILNLHQRVVEEMLRRGIPHEIKNGLDKGFKKLPIKNSEERLEQMKVEDFSRESLAEIDTDKLLSLHTEVHEIGKWMTI